MLQFGKKWLEDGGCIGHWIESLKLPFFWLWFGQALFPDSCRHWMAVLFKKLIAGKVSRLCHPKQNKLEASLAVGFPVGYFQ